jgi:hypothetical protein
MKATDPSLIRENPGDFPVGLLGPPEYGGPFSGLEHLPAG